MTRVLGVFAAALLVLALAASLPVAGGQSVPVYQEYFHRIQSTYISVNSSGVGPIVGPPNVSQVLYRVVEAEGSGVAANRTISANVTTYYSTSIGKPREVAVNVSSSYSESDMGLSVSVEASGATLVSVGVREHDITQLVWAGAQQLSGAFTVSGKAYVADLADAQLLVGFATAGGVSYAVGPLNQSFSVSLELQPISFAVASQGELVLASSTALPHRYQPYTAEVSFVNLSASISSQPVNVSVQAFFGAKYPAITWRGNTTVQLNLSTNVVHALANVSCETHSFYGVNGTLVGYVHLCGFTSTHTLVLGGLQVYAQAQGSSLHVVRLENQQEYSLGGQTDSYTASVGGEPVVVEVNSSLAASSTAIIEMSHVVYVNATGLLVYLNTTKAAGYLVLNTKTHTVAAVNETAPTSVKTTTITVGSVTYQAIRVDVTATGYIVFNITAPYQSIIVFKATPTGYVRLNTANYWVVGGRLYVFDDPSTTYYVANAASATTSAPGAPTTTGTGPGAQQTSSGAAGGAPSRTTIAVIVVVVLVIVVVAASLFAFTRAKR